MTIIQALDNLNRAIRSINASAEVHEGLRQSYETVYKYISDLENKFGTVTKEIEDIKAQLVEASNKS